MSNIEERFNAFKRGFTSSEIEYIEDCWIVFKMAVEFGTLYTIDLEEELPPLPWNVTVRQGYMIRQTLLDLAINLRDEKSQMG